MTTPSVRIRRATPDDVVILAQLNRFVHDLHVDARPDIFLLAHAASVLAPHFAAFLAREGAMAYIAESSETGPVGYITATIQNRSADALMHPQRFVYVNHIAVDPQAARTGVGSALVESVRAAALEAGCTSLLTDVWDFNTKALTFFENQGLGRIQHRLEQRL
ncbi:N-acetyltransferase family protein [Nonomuraea sp. bgisy101]|uniref:GNAT family N-acetyltransferase n=1 Tax=Nonomuraea sp. bgisy101 TaxID=3413784 RepID=UPI003D73DB83